MDNTNTTIISRRYSVIKNSWFHMKIHLGSYSMYQTGILKIFNADNKNIIYPVTKLPDIQFTKYYSAESIEEMDKYNIFDIYFYTSDNAMINVHIFNLNIKEIKVEKVSLSTAKKKISVWRLRKLFSLVHLKYYIDHLHKDLNNSQFLDRFSSDYVLLKDPNYFDKYIRKIKLTKFKNIPTDNNIMYLVDSSIQYENNDDTFRTHNILKAMNNNKPEGSDVCCVTRYGFPYDRDISISSKRVSSFLDNVKYVKLVKDTDNYNTNCIIKYLEKYINALIIMCLKMNITIIHSSTNYINGIAGMYAAKYLGIKSIYEIRSFAEDFILSTRPELYGSDLILMRNNLENIMLNNTDKLYVASYDFLDELTRRKINIEKVGIIPNGIDVPPNISNSISDISNISDSTEVNIPYPDDDEKINMLKRFKLDNIDMIVGYSGPIYNIKRWIETLDKLNTLYQKNNTSYKFVYIGYQKYWEILISNNNNILGNFLFINCDNISDASIYKYYNLLDIFLCVEDYMDITEDVIYKAMIMENLVIVYNSDNINKIIENGKTGLIFSNNIDLEKYLTLDIEDRLYIVSAGRKYSLDNGQWKDIIKKIVY